MSRDTICRCGRSKQAKFVVCKTCWSGIPRDVRVDVYAGGELARAAIRKCIEHARSQTQST